MQSASSAAPEHLRLIVHRIRVLGGLVVLRIQFIALVTGQFFIHATILIEHPYRKLQIPLARRHIQPRCIQALVSKQGGHHLETHASIHQRFREGMATSMRGDFLHTAYFLQFN